VDVWETQRRELSKKINCIRIGVIKSFDPGEAGVRGPTANVLVAQKQVAAVNADGTETVSDYPELKDVPVVFPNGGGFTLTFPISEGDECLLFFNDREIDNWVINGTGYPPTTGRLHDLADAVAFVGVRSNPNAIGNISTTAAQIRSDSGSVVVSLTQDTARIEAPNIEVHATESYKWDVYGYGEKVTYVGANTWNVDYYKTPRVIDTVNETSNEISPPEAG
jgi:hypothetical protein